jgi:hypothetical protein
MKKLDIRDTKQEKLNEINASQQVASETVTTMPHNRKQSRSDSLLTDRRDSGNAPVVFYVGGWRCGNRKKINKHGAM